MLALAGLGLTVLARGARSAVTRAKAIRGSARRGRVRHARLAATDVWIIDQPYSAAYTAGLLRPRIYLTEGAVKALEPAPLAAVIAHETDHVARRSWATAARFALPTAPPRAVLNSPAQAQTDISYPAARRSWQPAFTT